MGVTHGANCVRATGPFDERDSFQNSAHARVAYVYIHIRTSVFCYFSESNPRYARRYVRHVPRRGANMLTPVLIYTCIICVRVQRTCIIFVHAQFAATFFYFFVLTQVDTFRIL